MLIVRRGGRLHHVGHRGGHWSVCALEFVRVALEGKLLREELSASSKFLATGIHEICSRLISKTLMHAGAAARARS